MSPAVHREVARDGMLSVSLGRNDGCGTPCVQFGADPVDIERFVGEKRFERDPFDQRFDTDAIVALPRQEDKAHQVAQGIDQGDDLGRQSALRAPDGLISSPPLAPLAFW